MEVQVANIHGLAKMENVTGRDRQSKQRQKNVTGRRHKQR